MTTNEIVETLARMAEALAGLSEKVVRLQDRIEQLELCRFIELEKMKEDIAKLIENEVKY